MPDRSPSNKRMHLTIRYVASGDAERHEEEYRSGFLEDSDPLQHGKFKTKYPVRDRYFVQRCSETIVHFTPTALHGRKRTKKLDYLPNSSE